jgi:hypothetical protein
MTSLVVLTSTHFGLTILLYGDPGSGMLILQLAAAGALGVLFYAKTILRRIRYLIKSRGQKEDHEPPAAST